MATLLDGLISSYTKQFHNKKLMLGLSGGVDSVVLLYLLVQLRQQFSFTLDAIHINHGISENTQEWEHFCIKLCNSLHVTLHLSHHKVLKSGGESLENNARNIRYNVFSRLNTDIIVLAHHKNDQIETMLSQIIRGSDIHNIASMNYISTRGDKVFWRPLLNCTRNQIEQYALTNSITHIEDESNYNTKYLRNFIRHQLLPSMVNWDTNVINKLNNIVVQMQDTSHLLDELAQEDLFTCLFSTNTISVEKFNLLSKLRQVNMLNFFIRSKNLAIPSQKKIVEFCRQVNNSAWDRQPKLTITNKYYLLKNKNQIYVKFND
ncbi:MAG: tRNA lysidine(34) synthetase TilS [Burkholderiales bacterium]|nr:tRNA lysidine(34) synthetase TilS [Burkholderiales bacterium]